MYTIDGKFIKKNVYIENFDDKMNDLIKTKINQDNKVDNQKINNLQKNVNDNKNNIKNKTEKSIDELNKKIENIYYWSSMKFDDLIQNITNHIKSTENYNKFIYEKMISKTNDIANLLGVVPSGKWNIQNDLDWISYTNIDNILELKINNPLHDSNNLYKIVLELEIDKRLPLNVSDDVSYNSDSDKNFDELKLERGELLASSIEDLTNKLDLVNSQIDTLSDNLDRRVFNSDSIERLKVSLSDLTSKLPDDESTRSQIYELNNILKDLLPFETSGIESFENDFDYHDVEEKCLLSKIPNFINVIEKTSKDIEIDFNRICNMKLTNVNIMSKKRYYISDNNSNFFPNNTSTVTESFSDDSMSKKENEIHIIPKVDLNSNYNNMYFTEENKIRIQDNESEEDQYLYINQTEGRFFEKTNNINIAKEFKIEYINSDNDEARLSYTNGSVKKYLTGNSLGHYRRDKILSNIFTDTVNTFILENPKIKLTKEIFINIKKSNKSFSNVKDEIEEINTNLNYIYKLNELNIKSQELNKVNIDNNMAEINEAKSKVNEVQDNIDSTNENINLINQYLNSNIKDDNVFKQRLYEIGIPILEYPLMMKEYGTNKISNRFELIK